jgi:hypothetical protein
MIAEINQKRLESVSGNEILGVKMYLLIAPDYDTIFDDTIDFSHMYF